MGQREPAWTPTWTEDTGYYLLRKRRTRHGIQASPYGTQHSGHTYGFRTVQTVQRIQDQDTAAYALHTPSTRSSSMPRAHCTRPCPDTVWTCGGACGVLTCPVLPVTATFAVVDLPKKGTIPKTNTCLLRA
ncbi:hypothetical protein V496_10361 [Pseudogymnoascus sp. VKM F-4515 (FW-2607)]|nr:hypothetical protein V496_10361 [Pseudogymnoascus sp. VKM F-4515 (FW-2607)]